MRVLITRPEREAANLAQALRARQHEPVIAPLFQLQTLHPPEGFAASLAAAQAILITSANGARALAEVTEQRSKPLFAVGDTTAATAEGLGFTNVTSASGDAGALVALVSERLDPKAGPLLHVSGADVATELAPEGFEVQRVVLYEAREAESLPDSARAALAARAIDIATFFSPRASQLFVRLVKEAGLADTCRPITAIAISEAAAQPLAELPFGRTLAAERPTRQAVLDQIDRLPSGGVQSPLPMTDAAAPSPPEPLEPKTVEATVVPPPTPPRGLGVAGAFAIGLVAAVIVLAAALLSLPYWPQDARDLWRGQAAAPAPTPPAPAMDTAALDAAKRELGARLDDLDKKVRAAAATAAQASQNAGQSSAQPAPAAPAAPAEPDPAIAELRRKLETLENKPAPEPDTSAIKSEVVALRAALQSLDQAIAGQKASVDKAAEAAQASVSGEQKALNAARGSAVIGLAARIGAAVAAGQPFSADLALLTPLAQGDAKLTEMLTALQPHATNGVASRSNLAGSFPAMAKRAMADDLADDSFWQRLLGKLKSVVSLRRTGADVQGDSVEAKLARAEAAINAGDVAKSVELVKSLPQQTSRATADWLARAQAHLAAQRAVDQLAAQAVSLLGSAR